MWSIGCIMGELLGGKPLFPGTSTINQLCKIIEVQGQPSKAEIVAIKSPFAATMLESCKATNPKTLAEIYPSASPEALDLINKCLQWNPDKRLTAEEVGLLLCMQLPMNLSRLLEALLSSTR